MSKPQNNNHASMEENIYQQIAMLVESRRYGLAHEKITELLGILPNSWELHSLRAEVYIQEKQYEQGKASAQEAVALNPEADHALYLIAQAEIALLRNLEAEEAIERALMLDPTEPAYYAVKANICMNLDQYEQAIESATEGLRYAPDNISLNNLISMAERRLGRKEVAFERLQDMMAKDPENPMTHANMGYYFLQAGNHRQAKEHFAVALAKNPNFEFARLGMMQAMKATNILYAKLLQFAFWMEKIGKRNRWFLIIGLILVVALVPILAPFYLVFIFWTWFTAPISDAVLYSDKYGRYLMSPLTMRLTEVNIGLLAASIVALFFGVTWNYALYPLAFALFLSIIPVYMIEGRQKRSSKWILGGFASAFIGIGTWGVVHALSGADDPMMGWSMLVWAGVLFSWSSTALE